MQAKDIMTPNVECISPGMDLVETAKKMKSLDVGFIPLCESDRLVGTVTDRDIVVRAVAEDNDMRETTAGDIMTNEAFWCYEDQSVEEVSEFMADKEIRRVLVLDRNKRLVGVISIGDVAKAGEQTKAGESLKEIAEAPRSEAA
jgi:CBS domain-containing protein